MAWRFEPGERLGDAFRRVAAEEVAKVRAGLSDRDKDRARAIHEARQGFKRLRALLRLAEPALGPAFDDENRLYRDAGRALSGSRDQTVVIASFDRVAAGCGEGVLQVDLERLRADLATNGGHAGAANIEASVITALGLLQDAERRIGRLDWPGNADKLAKGLKRSQSRLGKTWKAARTTEVPQALHDWRKCVKDQAAQLRLFRSVAPMSLRARHGDEKKAAELLGEEHDLWLLGERLSDDALSASNAAACEVLLGKIDERREALRKGAFKIGKRFSSQKPKSFARDLTVAWKKNAAPARLKRAA